MEEKYKICVAKCLDILTQDETLSSSSSSSEDELEVLNVLELLKDLQNRPKRLCLRKYMDLVSTYTDNEFIQHFRIKRALYFNLCDKLRHSLGYQQISNTNITPEKHLAIFLWFAGHEECCFREVGDKFEISIATVHVVLKRVILFISKMSPDVIRWPNDDQKKRTAQHFLDNGFPNVIGCIDGSRIVIDMPIGNRDIYTDKNGKVSLGFQGICNEEKKFIDVSIGHPGSFHDNKILQDSIIYPELPRLCGDYYLLGDSAYSCKTFLMAPYVNNGNLNMEQTNFNETLGLCRIFIEQTINYWKQRFPQLYYCKLRDPQLQCLFIRACCVLHNLADLEDIEIMFDGTIGKMEVYPENEDGIEDADDYDGLTRREKLCMKISHKK